MSALMKEATLRRRGGRRVLALRMPGRASPSAIFRDSYFPRSVSHCFRWKVENRSASSATASTFSIYAS